MFRHFNRRHAIYLEFLPQIIFLICIFFYLIILIFYKWTHYDATQSGTAPALLIRKEKKCFSYYLEKIHLICIFEELINMILFSYPNTPESSAQFYSGQKGIQIFLVIISVLCIPWMFVGKPIYRIMMNKRRANVSFLLQLSIELMICKNKKQTEINNEQHLEKVFSSMFDLLILLSADYLFNAVNTDFCMF